MSDEHEVVRWRRASGWFRRSRPALARGRLPDPRLAARLGEREAISYFYVSGSVLTRDADAQRVAEALRSHPRDGRPRRAGPTTDSPHPGRHPRSRSSRPNTRRPKDDPTPGIVDGLEARLGPGVVNHEHAFELTPWWHCPATEPEAVAPPGTTNLAPYLWPPPSSGDAGRGVHVSVVDTGLLNGRRRTGRRGWPASPTTPRTTSRTRTPTTSRPTPARPTVSPTRTPGTARSSPG